MIKLAIIGTGGMANTHAKNFGSMKSVRIVACCDINEKRVKDFAEKYSIKNWFTDVDKMLDSIKLDAVSVVTSDDSHYKVSIKAIKRGLHVFCEKPLATNERDALEMLREAKRRNIITGVNFSYRNAACVQYAHKIIKQGRIGRIIHVEASYLQCWLSSMAWGNWRTDPKWLWRLSTKHHSNGTLGDIGVHIYDMVSFVVGEFEEINCLLKTFDKGVKRIGEYVLDANDSFVSMVKFKNGAIGTIHSSRWATGHNNSLVLRVFGDKGAIEIDLDKSYHLIRICKGKDNINQTIWEEIRCPKVPTMYERFIRSIQTKKQDRPSFEDGAKVQRYLDKSFLSNKLNKWVKV